MGVLLTCVSNFVPDSLRIHPDVVDDLKAVTAVSDGACRNEHSGGVVFTGHRRATRAAKPRLPICVWLLPRCDVLIASDPTELTVRNDNNRDTIAPCGLAADRAVAHEYT